VALTSSERALSIRVSERSAMAVAKVVRGAGGLCTMADHEHHAFTPNTPRCLRLSSSKFQSCCHFAKHNCALVKELRLLPLTVHCEYIHVFLCVVRLMYLCCVCAISVLSACYEYVCVVLSLCVRTCERLPVTSFTLLQRCAA